MSRFDLFTNVILIGFCCCAPPVVIALFAGVFYTSWYQPRTQITQLAEQLGWKRDTRYHSLYFGYVGPHQARPVELTLTARHTGHSGPRSIRWRPALGFTLELQLRQPRRLDASAYRHFSPQDPFESVFRQERSEPISEAARAAMLNFARKHMSLSLSSFPSDSTQPVTKLELSYKSDRLGTMTPAEARAVLDELIAVARVIETTHRG